MSIRVGTLEASDVRVGTTRAAKVMVGATQVWPSGTAAPAYVAKAIDLGATFVQVGGFDHVSGLALPSGSDPSVSVDDIAAWTGDFTMNIGDQMAAGGDWSACAIWRRTDYTTGWGYLGSGGQPGDNTGTHIATAQSDTTSVTLGRFRHANTFTIPRSVFDPWQVLGDWAFSGFATEGTGGTAAAVTTTNTYVWDSTNLPVYEAKGRSNQPGTLNQAIVSGGSLIQYAGFAIFPNVLLTQTDFQDLYALLPSVGQGNS